MRECISRVCMRVILLLGYACATTHRRIRIACVCEYDACVVPRCLLEVPFVPERKLRCIKKAFSDLCFLCVVGSPPPAGLGNQKAP